MTGPIGQWYYHLVLQPRPRNQVWPILATVGTRDKCLNNEGALLCDMHRTLREVAHEAPLLFNPSVYVPCITATLLRGWVPREA